MMILRQVYAVLERVFAAPPETGGDARVRLRWLLYTHVLLTDVMQPWFYFAFMEARSFHKEARDYVLQSELFTERLLEDALTQGPCPRGVRYPRCANDGCVDQAALAGLVCQVMEVSTATCIRGALCRGDYAVCRAFRLRARESASTLCQSGGPSSLVAVGREPARLTGLAA
jgi:hypothetical protein